ncbi:MAG: flagellar hook-length control protein FliK [Desulfobulbus sp.]|jgi:flagellar hook-length control protein FliK|uniref:flagellar hook-length control protein FliK n=1 Tax=Desulfobulbus sp. TaxID=895 RepID=UPI00283EB2E0|nr:flagellar hook-length control protein FliK [Desulfobulbus sp.]MDR2550766.1 flagellar hook-length control protein FliK [Desulfobulbus sp.]
MPALAIVSADLMTSAPQPAAPANTGNEGRFASHLKTATDQQSTASAQQAGTRQKHARGRQARDAAEAQGAKKTEAAQTKGAAEDTTAASPNGKADTAAQQPESAIQADTAPPENMLVNPQTIGQQQRESAVARLLARLTAGVGDDLRANISSQASQSMVPQAGGQMAAQPAPIQLPGELADAAALAAATAAEMPPATPAPAGQSTTPGTQTGSVASAASTVSQTTQTAQQPQITISVAAANPQATDADTAPLAPVATTGEDAAAADTQTQAGGPMIVQNKYGQIITIHQGKPGEEESEGDIPASPATVSEDQPVDVDGNYIRSRLLKERAGAPAESGKSTQTDSTSQAAKQQEQTSTAEAMKPATTGEQLASQKTQPVVNHDPSPLVAAGQPLSTGQQTSTSTPIASVTMHLPSGMTVPDSTVVDQMIAHFSINKQLANSTVTLRLYPEELGELRMEIKVAQDNIKAHIVVQSPQAQEMIDRHLPRLREALEQQGLQLNQVEVSVAAQGHTGGERFQENNAWRQQASSPSSHIAAPSDFSQELEEVAGDDGAASTLSVLV